MTRVVLFGVLAAGLALEAQVKFSTRVESVRVDVLATQDGRPVPGLTADDFEVRDNGVVQDITLLDREHTPVNVLMALDTSGSLDGDRLDNLRKAGRAILRRLHSDESAGLITFSHVVRTVAPLTTDHRTVDAALSTVAPAGFTSLIDAVSVGFTLMDQAAGRGLLVVFSDGTDTSSWQDAERVTNAAKRVETVLYGVSITPRFQSDPFLRAVASATGGKVFDVQANDRLESAFTEILDEFRQRYLLTYSPTNVARGGWHRIDVRVKRRGVTVSARPGYFGG